MSVGGGRKRIALNINFDSLSDCMKLAGCSPIPVTQYLDPCFFAVMDRFLNICAEYNAPLTLFMIGQDLKNPAHAEAVARWHSMGHEIANHSFTHRHDLSVAPIHEVQDEIEKCHEIITQTIGKPPSGFTSPGWHAGQSILETLSKLDYKYDASLGPTWTFLLASFVLWLKSPAARDRLSMIRPDWLGNLMGQKHAYLPSQRNYLKKGSEEDRDVSPLMIPLPTSNWFRFGVWHTLSFSYPGWLFDFLLKSSLKSSRSFYYLMHPADLLDPKTDLVGFPTELKNIHRMMVPIEIKEKKLRRTLEILSQEGSFVTMSELVETTEVQLSKNSFSAQVYECVKKEDLDIG